MRILVSNPLNFSRTASSRALVDSFAYQRELKAKSFENRNEENPRRKNSREGDFLFPRETRSTPLVSTFDIESQGKVGRHVNAYHRAYYFHVRRGTRHRSARTKRYSLKIATRSTVSARGTGTCARVPQTGALTSELATV